MPQALELGRALRPLKKQVDSRTRRVLDEKATVQRIAEDGLWLPVERPAPELWLDAVLVLDDSNSMLPWRQTLNEFRRMITRHGAFRSVTTCWLYKGALYAGPRKGSPPRQMAPKEILSADQRRLILVLTDGITPGWQDGSLATLLSGWAKKHPVTLLQLLPRRMWARTALARAQRVNLTAPGPLTPNTTLKLEVVSPNKRISRPVVTNDWFSDKLGVPVIPVEASTLANWSQFITTGSSVNPIEGLALVFPDGVKKPDPPRTVSPTINRTEQDARYRYERFLATASPEAHDLATFLSCVPVSLPVARLVQATQLPNPQSLTLAEVWLSGLLIHKNEYTEHTDPERMQYDFYPGLRDLLLAELTIPKTFEILNRASEYISRQYGQTRDFTAYLLDLSKAGNLDPHSEEARFAALGLDILRRMGSQYQALADRIEKGEVETPRSEEPKDTPPPAERSLLDLRGYFVLPQLTRQGYVRRFGRGIINQVFLPTDNHVLVVASGGAALFEMGSSEPLWEIDCPTECAALSRDGRKLALGANKNIYLWDTATGQYLSSLEGHSDSVRSVAFSPDGERLASGSRDETIKLWDTTSAQLLISFKGHSGWVTNVVFSPDGERLASGSGDGTIKLWDTTTAQLLASLEGHSGWVTSVAFSPDGERLASGSRDETIKLWDTTSAQLLISFKGHSGWVTSVAFSPDGERLASGSRDETIKVWNTTTAQLLASLDGHSGWVTSVVFSPDGERLASGSDGNTIKLWNTTTAQLLASLDGHSDQVRSVAFSPDGERLASGSRDNTIKLWDTTSAQLLASLDGHSDSVRSVAFSPDGERLASGSRDNIIKLWDTVTAQLLASLDGHSRSVTSVVFSPDGKRLASGSGDNTIKLWDTATAQLLASLDGHSRSVTSVVFSPDGKRLASGSRDTTIKVWNTTTAQLLASLDGHSGSVNSVAFSPDGERLASGSDDGTIKLWNTATAQLLASLDGHSGWVTSVVFSPDGKRLASGSRDTTIKVWNTTTAQLLASLDGHSGWVSSVAFSPDRLYLASASDDGTIRLWKVSRFERFRKIFRRR